MLRIVARLIAGGLKTRVYMVSTGNFDTHSSQVEAAETSIGGHAQLIARVSDAIKCFMDDIKGLKVDERVIGFTFSEFGRRIKSNASGGTDHGAAAPVFYFGHAVKPGIIGVNPTIPATATVNDNVPMQHDFRSLYASILTGWNGLDQKDVQEILMSQYPLLPMV